MKPQLIIAIQHAVRVQLRQLALNFETSKCSQVARSDPFTAHSLQLQYISTQPAIVVTQNFLHAYETPSCLPTHFAVTLSMYTLIPTVYRALLKSAVSGIGLRIHTTKKMPASYCSWLENVSSEQATNGQSFCHVVDLDTCLCFHDKFVCR